MRKILLLCLLALPFLTMAQASHFEIHNNTPYDIFYKMGGVDGACSSVPNNTLYMVPPFTQTAFGIPENALHTVRFYSQDIFFGGPCTATANCLNPFGTPLYPCLPFSPTGTGPTSFLFDPMCTGSLVQIEWIYSYYGPTGSEVLIVIN
jgi:hypothetical protein